METEETRALEALQAELQIRGWPAAIDGSSVRVRNPNAGSLSESIVWRDGTYRYPWGQEVSPDPDVTEVAQRIMYVLREVAPAGP